MIGFAPHILVFLVAHTPLLRFSYKPITIDDLVRKVYEMTGYTTEYSQSGENMQMEKPI
jgi:hypothetical protein